MGDAPHNNWAGMNRPCGNGGEGTNRAATGAAGGTAGSGGTGSRSFMQYGMPRQFQHSHCTEAATPVRPAQGGGAGNSGDSIPPIRHLLAVASSASGNSAVTGERGIRKGRSGRTAGTSPVSDANRRPFKRVRFHDRPEVEARGAPDADQVASFLQRFPTLERFHSEFPELQSMTVPAEVDAKGFDTFLKRVMRPDQYGGLTGFCTPKAILAGLRKLHARRDRSFVNPPLPPHKTETAERWEAEATAPKGGETAGRSEQAKSAKPAPRRRSDLHCLINCEIGIASHPVGRRAAVDYDRLAAVDYDRLASLWMTAEYDIEKLRPHYGEIHSLLEVFQRESRQLWPLLRALEWVQPEVQSTIPVIIAPFVDENVASLRWILNFERETWSFLRDAFYLECTYFFLKKATQIVEGSLKASEVLELCSEFIESTKRSVVKKTYLSVLRCKKAKEFGSLTGFEKILVPTLIGLVKTGDFEKARKTLWRIAETVDARLPLRNHVSRGGESKAASRALDIVREEQLNTDMGDRRLARFTDGQRQHLLELVYDIVYCCFFCANDDRYRDEAWGVNAPPVLHEALRDLCFLVGSPQPH